MTIEQLVKAHTIYPSNDPIICSVWLEEDRVDPQIFGVVRQYLYDDKVPLVSERVSEIAHLIDWDSIEPSVTVLDKHKHTEYIWRMEAGKRELDAEIARLTQEYRKKAYQTLVDVAINRNDEA